jgi:hypothetical protein
MEPKESELLECATCGNVAPHSLTYRYEAKTLVDELEDGTYVFEPFTWLSYVCGTCAALNLYGDHLQLNEDPFVEKKLKNFRLYPKGSSILPESHMLSPKDPIPYQILNLYEEVWAIRYRAPSAFIGQIRRLLEYICDDQGATGRTLFKKLEHLAEKGVFPGHIENITEMLRLVGNLGAHATGARLDQWDAAHIDDFFRFVVEYVYIAPAKLKRMRERLSVRESQ